MQRLKTSLARKIREKKISFRDTKCESSRGIKVDTERAIRRGMSLMNTICSSS